MKSMILFAWLLVAVLSLQGPPPPVWPETFSQDFVQGDNKTRVYESGKLWYDIKNNRQRVDYSGSVFEPVCLALAQEPSTKCSTIFANDALYIQLPEKSKCCKCCTAADGCVPTPRDWLLSFEYSGEATLSGQTFYKWSKGKENYYATEDDQRVPRRIDAGTFALDFIMNTYSTDKIEDSIFSLPSSCNTLCPRNICFESFEKQSEAKNLRQALFGRRAGLKNLRK